MVRSFLKKEDYILENTNPWGQGNSSWKWKGVLRDARDEKVDLEEEFAQEFAQMMMFIETAQGVDGVCGVLTRTIAHHIETCSSQRNGPCQKQRLLFYR